MLGAGNEAVTGVVEGMEDAQLRTKGFVEFGMVRAEDPPLVELT